MLRRQVSPLTFWLAVGMAVLLAVGSYLFLRSRPPEAERFQLPARPAAVE